MSRPAFESIRASYQKANALVQQGRAAVDSLQLLIAALDDRVASLTAINADMGADIEKLMAERQFLSEQLDGAKRRVFVQESALERIRNLLPARRLKRLGPDATPDQLAGAVEDHLDRLTRRAKRQAIGGLLLGTLISVAILL